MRLHRRFTSTRAAGLVALAAGLGMGLAVPAVAAGPTLSLGVSIRFSSASPNTLSVSGPARVAMTVTNHSAAKSSTAMAVTMTLTHNGAVVPNVPLGRRSATLPAAPAHSTKSAGKVLAFARGLESGPGYRVKLCPAPSVVTRLHKAKAPACAQSKPFSLAAPLVAGQNAVAVKAAVGQVTQVPITIRSRFGAELDKVTAAINGTGASAFSLVAGSDVCLGLVSDCQIKVAFAPTAPGTYNANLTLVVPSIGDGSAIAVPLTGTGV
jgi:hypothetical protein